MTSTTDDIQVGDWVRVYHENKLTVLEVRYVRRSRVGGLLVYTDYGQTEPDAILEVRRMAEFIKGDG